MTAFFAHSVPDLEDPAATDEYVEAALQADAEATDLVPTPQAVLEQLKRGLRLPGEPETTEEP